MQRTIPRHIVRILLLGIVAFGSVAIPNGLVLFWAAIGAFIALDGPERSFGPLLITALLAESFSGLGLGALSLPVVIAIALLTIAGRFIAIAPWPVGERWHPEAAVRAWVAACVSSAFVAMLTGFSTAVLYGYAIGSMMDSVLVRSHFLLGMPIIVALMLGILRRVDVPFRTRIQFGS